MSDKPLEVEGLVLNPTPEQLATHRARLVEIADRSIVTELFNIELPPELHGEWIGVDGYSQYQAKMKGFVDGSQFVDPTKFIHMSSEGGRVGDVKFMVMPKWKYEEDKAFATAASLRRNGLKADNLTNDLLKQHGISPMRGQNSTTSIVDGDTFVADVTKQINKLRE